MGLAGIQSLLCSGGLERAAARLANLPVAQAAKIISEIDPCSRYDLLCSISERDQELSVRIMAGLSEDLKLELAGEIGLKAIEGSESAAGRLSLLKTLISRMPEVLTEMRLFAYDIFCQNAAGSESVADMRSLNGWRMVATRTRLAERSAVRNTRLLSYHCGPTRYRALLDQAELASAIFDKGGVRWSVGTSKGVRNREMKLLDEVVVLDTFVWHHFSMLTERYKIAEGGRQKVEVFVPSIGRRVSAAIDMFESMHPAPGRIAQFGDVYRVIFPGRTVVQIHVGPNENPAIILENDQRLLAIGREIHIFK